MDRLGGDFGAFDEGGGYDESVADDGAHSNPPPSAVGQDERRMQVRAYNHWASLLGERNYPNIEELEPEFLGDFGPYSVLLDFSTGSGTPTLQYIGNELRGECRVHDLIETLSEIPRDSLLSKVAENYLRVVTARGPVTFEAEALNARGAAVAYRGILLPYSSDDDTIDFVYAVVNWKEVADAATADALLDEIDAALAAAAPPVTHDPVRDTAEIVHFDPHAREEEAEPAPADYEDVSGDPWATDDNILEMRAADQSGGDELDDLPAPSFGQAEEEEDSLDSYDPNAYEPADTSPAEETPVAPKRNRAVDALGNPIGGTAAEEDSEEPAGGGITTASEYGLPEWDEEEPEEDVDEVVNPLADIDLNSRLLSLVNSNARSKKTVDLATLSETAMERDDEDDGEDDRPLFKPKAPSIDTVLTVEDHDEEEDEDYADYGYAEEPGFEAQAEDFADEFAEEPVEISDAGAVEPVEAGPEPFEEEALEVSDEIAEEIFEVGEEFVAEEHSADLEPVLEISDEVFEDFAEPEAEAEAEAEVEADIEPEAPEAVTVANPLGLADVIEEPAFEEEPAAEREPVTEIVEPAFTAETDLDEAPFELTEELAIVEEEELEVHAEEAALPEAEVVDDAGEPESLTGLLAAVQQLADAARTTQDADRKALYEAVGKAFDISIKAVLASDSRADGSVDIQPLDLDGQFEEMKALAQRQAG